MAILQEKLTISLVFSHAGVLSRSMLDWRSVVIVVVVVVVAVVGIAGATREEVFCMPGAYRTFPRNATNCHARICIA